VLSRRAIRTYRGEPQRGEDGLHGPDPGSDGGIQDIEEIVVQQNNGVPIRIKDIGRVVDGFEDAENRGPHQRDKRRHHQHPEADWATRLDR